MQDYINRKTDINDDIPSMTIKQYDNNSRKVYISLTDKDNPNEVSVNIQGDKVRAYFLLPDKSAEFVDGEIYNADEGIIAVTIPSSVTQQIGTVLCEISITSTDNSTLLSLRTFNINILPSIRDDKAIEATSQFSALEEAIITVDGLEARMNSLAAMADNGDIPAGTIESEVIDARCGHDSLHDAIEAAMNSGGATPEQAAQIEQNKNDIADIKTDLSQVNEKIETTKTQQAKAIKSISNAVGIVICDNFELGNINITDSGWRYYASATRVRTKEGSTINLNIGDVISLSDYSDAKIYLGWLKADGSYAAKGWITSDYTVTENAEYVILLAHNADRTLDNVDELLSLLKIYKPNGMDDLSKKVDMVVDSISAVEAKVEKNESDISEISSVMIKGVNRYNKDTDDLGYGINTRGVPTADSRFRLSQGIEIPPHKAFAVSGLYNGNVVRQFDYSIRSFTVFSDKSCTAESFIAQDTTQKTKYYNDSNNPVWVRLLCWYNHPTTTCEDVMLEIFDTLDDIALNEYQPYGFLLKSESLYPPIEDYLPKSNNSNNTFCLSIIHGGTNVYPSNTLGLYKTAFNKNGIKAWECDVRPCADDYVLCHDNDIYNHAVNADGSVISQGSVLILQKTASELKSYKFGVITNKQSEGVVSGFENETIPTLREFLNLAKVYGATPFVEIKFTPTTQQMKDIVDIIKSCGMLEHTVIIAYESVAKVVQYACDNGIKKLSLIINNGEASTAAVDTAYSYIADYINNLDKVYFNPAYNNLVNTDIALYAKEKGMDICTWTISDSTQIATLKAILGKGCSAFTDNNISSVERLKSTM